MSRRERIVLITLLGMIAALGPLSMDMYLPALPTVQSALAGSAAQTQMTLSAFLIGFAAGQLLYGPLSDRYGRKPVLLSGIMLYVVTSVLCATAASIEGLITFRFVQALGGGAGIVLARAVVRDHFPADETARLISLMSIITLSGPLVSPIIGGYLLVLAGWRSIFWLLAAIGTLYWIMASTIMEESHPKEQRQDLRILSTFRAYFEVLRHRRAFGYIACVSLGAGALFAYLLSSPFIIIEIYGVPPDMFGYTHGVIVIGLICGAVINSRMVMARGLHRMISSGLLIRLVGALLVLLLALTDFGGLAAFILAMVLVIAPNALVFANTSAALMEIFPRITGTASAVLGAAMIGFGGLAGSAVGLVHDGTLVPVAVAIAVLSFASAGVYWWLVVPPVTPASRRRPAP